ncbi:fungal specific transcription factor domain-containing protein [Aspergillus mulundensis]|uniref:Transcription factor domain-containing protein n=1 Tax=Aspergillus mulundensis TaxID=1810919 RepID=A0A3D8T3B2_9EURO|nr:hypothetical protein DSM5745_00263 [Aspergillus mulundensis]RDW92941.1 hypothetical protein DSM5745_00263 [Aspergillus mulundensis]
MEHAVPQTSNLPGLPLSYSDLVCKEHPDPLSSLLCFNLPRSLSGQTGPSPLSIFSSVGKQWLQNAVGDEPLDWDVLSPMFAPDPSLDMDYSPLRRPFIPLPAKDDARCLLNIYFQSFNTFCPTFDEHEFMLHFELEYPVQPEPCPAKWACVNAALALAASLDPRLSGQAGLFWKNAMMSWAPSSWKRRAFIPHRLWWLWYVPHQMDFRNRLLTRYQAVYSIGTFQSQTSSTIIPMAIRTLHGLSPTETNGSKHFEIVLVLARSLDIDHALQGGDPPTDLSDGDLYRAMPVQEMGTDSIRSFDFYEAFSALTRLKEDVYRELYSVSARKKSDSKVLARVGGLDARLEDWKHTIPEEYRPGRPTAAETIKQGNCVLVVYMHLSYHNCLLAIHRRTASFTAASLRLDSSLKMGNAIRSLNTRALISSRLCAEASRATLQLVRFIPVGSQLACGLIISHIVFALKLFAVTIVQDPSSPRVQFDLRLIRNVEAFLSQLPISAGDKGISKLREYCERYREVTENAMKQGAIQKRQ